MPWTTEDEIDYLKGIGSHSVKARVTSAADRIALLKNYIKAASFRSNWGEIDESRALSYARQRLLTLELKTG